jgi:hypothetical protein
MLRLSKRAWNNVLIVSMLVMILLFNTTTNFLNDGDQETATMPLLPEGSVIMTLEMGDVKVERIGRGWRSNASPAVPEATLARLVARWSEAQLNVYDIPSDEQPLVAIVWLAGDTQGQVFQLYPAGKDTLVQYQLQWFILTNTAITDLVLPGVL